MRKSKIIVTLLAVILVSLLTFGTSVFSDTDGDLVDEQDVLDYYYPNEPDTDYEPVVNEEQTEHTTGDTDGDLVDDAMEYYYYGTDPLCPDTDGDGLTDCEEIKNGFDPLDQNNPYFTCTPTFDDSDTDGDLVDEQDVLDYYYPNEPDTDYEPVVNEEQTEHTTGDTDGDLVDDAMEYYYYGTDPLCPDTDGDGLTDCEEIKNGSNPLDPNNS